MTELAGAMIAENKLDFSVTEDKIDALVNRIVAAVDPLQVIVFGSRARGEHGPHSDLDLAVIVEAEEQSHPRLPRGVRDGISMSVDVLVIASERYERFRPWINTVHRAIDREGVRVYERSGKSADRDTLRRLC